MARREPDAAAPEFLRAALDRGLRLAFGSVADFSCGGERGFDLGSRSGRKPGTAADSDLLSGRASIPVPAETCSRATCDAPRPVDPSRGFPERSADVRPVVAFSGGRDSLALLTIATERLGARAVRAVHVHHGLHDRADAQAAFCEAFATQLGVDFDCARVRVEPRGEGIEAAARKVRYQALEARLPAGGVVLTAHHAGDQAESFLLAALRGSGAAGLAAMPMLRALGRGWLLRPWRDVEPSWIAAFARARALRWFEDPTNDDLRLRRNALRHVGLPALRACLGSPAATDADSQSVTPRDGVAPVSTPTVSVAPVSSAPVSSAPEAMNAGGMDAGKTRADETRADKTKADETGAVRTSEDSATIGVAETVVSRRCSASRRDADVAGFKDRASSHCPDSTWSLDASGGDALAGAAVVRALATSAGLLGATRAGEQVVAERLLASCRDACGAIVIDALLPLPDVWRHAVVRAWLGDRATGIRRRALSEFLRQVESADAGRSARSGGAMLRWSGGQMHVSAGRIHRLDPEWQQQLARHGCARLLQTCQALMSKESAAEQVGERVEWKRLEAGTRWLGKASGSTIVGSLKRVGIPCWARQVAAGLEGAEGTIGVAIPVPSTHAGLEQQWQASLARAFRVEVVADASPGTAVACWIVAVRRR